MKTLRLLRNIAVLFILLMALLALRPGLGISRADSGKGCFFKLGYNCTYTTNNGGNCQDSPCQKGGSCTDSGCVRVKPF